MGDPTRVGKWLDPFPTLNVAAHATLLPTGKILCWGRRTDPLSKDPATMSQTTTVPFLIDMSTGPPSCVKTKSGPTSVTPPKTGQSDVNLFCSGHCLRPDGNVFVVGGHVQDGQGAKQACVYNSFEDTWTPLEPPNDGRWYPSAITLPDSTIFTISGAGNKAWITNNIPQIWRDGPTKDAKGGWITVNSPDPASSAAALYPRLHLAPNGWIFVAGPAKQSNLFSVDKSAVASATSASTVGNWLFDGPSLQRINNAREYGSSAPFDNGKGDAGQDRGGNIMWVGGGNAEVRDGNGNVVPDKDNPAKSIGPPTSAAETINLNDSQPKWNAQVTPMYFPRRQHTATTLPDGTVLVTGGTMGGGFNDLTQGPPRMPVHAPEIWNPITGVWTIMAEEECDRCYHGVALLLPTGEVLSAGSGEDGGAFADPPFFNQLQGQVFQPPYLFKGARPKITGPPALLARPPKGFEVKYGQTFSVTVNPTDTIVKVTWIRLGSVTHAMNLNQTAVFQTLPKPQTGTLNLKAPVNRNMAPPGHYMLFVLNAAGVPAEAPIVKILPDQTNDEAQPSKPDRKPPTSSLMASSALMARQAPMTLPDLDKQIASQQTMPAVSVGLTPSCPYGLGPCWAGAAEGLKSISDVATVRPVPDHANSVAFVHLKEDKLPDIDQWRHEFASSANGAYGKLLTP
jgi:galactose oxidase